MDYLVNCLEISEEDYEKITKSKQSAPETPEVLAHKSCRSVRQCGNSSRTHCQPHHWLGCATADPSLQLDTMYSNGWIIRVTPHDYFNDVNNEPLSNLTIGVDYFVHYTLLAI